MSGFLIGDIGSTKGCWSWLSGQDVQIFYTSGYNPVSQHSDVLEQMLREVERALPGPVSKGWYYGAGIIDEKTGLVVGSQMQEALQIEMQCFSDLLGAARGISSGEQSVVCILGTGSSSLLFDGRAVVDQIPGLGYPLGDEGSGSDIGRACVRGFYYRLMPPELMAAFASELPADRVEFLAALAADPAPGRTLAALVPVLLPFAESAFVSALLQDSFRTFARLRIRPYGTDYPVHSVGGIADTFKKIWHAVLAEEGLIPGKVMKDPMPGLIAFHQKNFYE